MRLSAPCRGSSRSAGERTGASRGQPQAQALSRTRAELVPAQLVSPQEVYGIARISLTL